MSSGHFLDKKSKSASVSDLFPCSPVLLDNLTLRCRLKAGESGPVDSSKSGKRIHKYLGPEQWRGYFANPYIYPTYRGAPYLKVFGDKTVRTNGKRIYRAEIGEPLPHHRGHNSTRDRVEAKNQLDLEEIDHLMSIAEGKKKEPHVWQLICGLAAVAESRDFIMKEQGLDSWNPSNEVRQHVVVERLEIYFEVLTHIQIDALTEALERVLYLYFKTATKRRNRIEESHDDIDRNSYVTWETSQRKVHNDFTGSKEFKFKAYKKDDRLRIEFQANYPKFKDPSIWDGTTNPYYPVFRDAVRTATILETTLNFIWSKVIEYFADDLKPNALIPKIESRLSELKPIKRRHQNADKVIQHLGNFRAITLADLKGFGWDRNDLKIMAHPEFGFLKKQEVGFADLVDGIKSESKKAVRGVYVVVPEWLDRVGKPQSKTSDKSLLIQQIPKLLAHKREAPIDELMSSGSATPSRGLSIFSTSAQTPTNKP